MTGKTNAIQDNSILLKLIGDILHSRVAEIKNTWVPQTWQFDNVKEGSYALCVVTYVSNSNNQYTVTATNGIIERNADTPLGQDRFLVKVTGSPLIINTNWYHHGENWNNDSRVQVYGTPK